MTSETSHTPLPSKKKRWPWRTTLIILAVTCGLLLAGLLVRYWIIKNDLANQAFESARNQAVAAADQLEEDFEGTMNLAGDLAQDLSNGALAYEEIEPRLLQILEQNESLNGITVAFAEDVYKPDSGLFYIYVSRDPVSGYQSELRESLYDYTLPPSEEPDGPQTEWYYGPANSGPIWTEPFLATGAGQVLISYGVPFTAMGTVDEEAAGVVSIDYSLNSMRGLVSDLDLGLTGFGAVYSDSGTFLSHPIPERVAKGNIFSDPTLQNENFQDAARQALAGETVSIQREVDDQSVWNLFTPITATGWALVVQLSESEFFLGQNVLLNNQVALVLAGGAFLFFILSVILHFDEASRDRLWLASITFSFIGLVIILIIIGLARNNPVGLGDGVLLTSQAGLERYQEELTKEYVERGLKAPLEVPTGVLIQSARFPEPSVVTLNGYIWQRIPKIEA